MFLLRDDDSTLHKTTAVQISSDDTLLDWLSP